MIYKHNEQKYTLIFTKNLNITTLITIHHRKKTHKNLIVFRKVKGDLPGTPQGHGTPLYGKTSHTIPIPFRDSYGSGGGIIFSTESIPRLGR